MEPTKRRPAFHADRDRGVVSVSVRRRGVFTPQQLAKIGYLMHKLEVRVCFQHLFPVKWPQLVEFPPSRLDPSPSPANQRSRALSRVHARTRERVLSTKRVLPRRHRLAAGRNVGFFFRLVFRQQNATLPPSFTSPGLACSLAALFR